MLKSRQLTLITRNGEKEEYYARKLGTTRIENLKATVGVFVANGPDGSFLGMWLLVKL